MYAGRVYADFQNLDDENRVRLTTAGTLKDLHEKCFATQPGAVIRLYSDDADDEGRFDPLFGDGVVELGAGGEWVARIDWPTVRHASDDLRLLKKRFFDTAIGDTLRALNGGSLIGATTLALCVLDHLGYLSTGNGDPADFQHIVKKYLTTVHVGYDPQWLWDVRNGLVHAHGQSKRSLQGNQPVHVTFTDQNPEHHLTLCSTQRGVTKWLNVDSFIADVVLAAWNAFADFERDPSVPLSVFPGLLIVGQLNSEADKAYAKMHKCLTPFDSPPVQRKALIEGIQALLRETPQQAA